MKSKYWKSELKIKWEQAEDRFLLELMAKYPSEPLADLERKNNGHPSLEGRTPASIQQRLCWLRKKTA